MRTFLEAIDSLHPNALVAWDRDVGTEPPTNVAVVAYGNVPIWAPLNQFQLAHNGIGVVHNEGSEFWCVLHKAPNDLGVAWYEAHREMPTCDECGDLTRTRFVEDSHRCANVCRRCVP